tara:strand:+ start:15005 stop:15739 length:735 start_codon:yes stop_codon:yes gene_type:complete
MSKFGQIKSNIESLMVESYSKNSFKSNTISFKKNIIDNAKLAEAYFLYDELSKNKGLSNDILDDYINESIEIIKKIVVSEKSKIKEVDMWISENLSKSVTNSYNDIDTIVYNKSIKHLEKVLECKNNIKKLLGKSIKSENVLESFNIPISSMISIATNTFNKEYDNISEEEQKELKSLLSLNKSELSEEIIKSKKVVLSKLSEKINESKDIELNDQVKKTIEKINESDVSLTSLYKLKQLEQGL